MLNDFIKNILNNLLMAPNPNEIKIIPNVLKDFIKFLYRKYFTKNANNFSGELIKQNSTIASGETL